MRILRYATGSIPLLYRHCLGGTVVLAFFGSFEDFPKSAPMLFFTPANESEQFRLRPKNF